MSQLNMTDDGDLAIGNNQLTIVKEKEEIRQRLLQNLRTFLGEWFLDTTIGVSYYEVIFDKGMPEPLIADAFKDEILKTEGVTELREFKKLDLNSATRRLTVDFTVNTIFGEIRLTETLP